MRFSRQKWTIRINAFSYVERRVRFIESALLDIITYRSLNDRDAIAVPPGVFGRVCILSNS